MELNLLDLDLFYLCLEHSQNNTLWANYYMSPVVIVIDLWHKLVRTKQLCKQYIVFVIV